MTDVSLVVEGLLDEAVGRRLAAVAGLSVCRVLGRRGVGYINARLEKFKRASRVTPFFVLIDLCDTGSPCAPSALSAYSMASSTSFKLRFAVMEIEAWLMADPESLAHFLRIPRSKIPAQPELVADPKATLIALARKSRLASRRKLMVPSATLGGSEGPGYTSELISYVANDWDPMKARKLSKSLDGCITALTQLRGPAIP
jgi:hypothetical protein